MPITERNRESKPDSAWPGHEFELLVGRGTLAGLARRGGDLVGEAVPATDPVQADAGSAAAATATMTKNCSTSL